MPQAPTPPLPSRRFDFERDTFAFPNELVCEYRFGTPNGRPQIARRQPPPTYSHRCFVLTRSARQFFFHAEFDAQHSPLDEEDYRRRIRAVVSRSPRVPCPAEARVRFPGFTCLRSFSQSWAELLKRECGGAWQSYFQRSHWRMVLPISRQHQSRTAQGLQERLAQGGAPIVHLVRFPQLTINHSISIFGCQQSERETSFCAYDPNYPERPGSLTYEHATQCFSMPANRYWEGGLLDVIEIYYSALM